MPEFRTSNQRRQKSRTVSQNNKNVSTYAGNIPRTVRSESEADHNTIGTETKSESTKKIDINGNLHLDSLTVHEQGTDIARKEVPSTNSTECPTQGDNVASRIESRSRRGSDCSMKSIQSPPLPYVGVIRDYKSNEESGTSAKHSPSAVFTTTSTDHHNGTASHEPTANHASHEPTANHNNARRHRSVPRTSQGWTGFRSSSCQRKPASFNTDGHSMQRDFIKRHGDSAPLKTGANKKGHPRPGSHAFAAAPCFNIPINHAFHPNPFPYGPQMPQLNLTDHQRLQLWNNIRCDGRIFPLHPLAHGAYQAGRQFHDKNFASAFKEKYPHNSCRDQPGKANRFQNRFKSRKHSTLEGTGIHNPPCKDLTPNGRDVPQTRPSSDTHLPDQRGKETAENLHSDDPTGILLPESVKHPLSMSKDSKETDNPIRHSEYKVNNSQRQSESSVADLEYTFSKTLQLNSKSCGARNNKASPVVQCQTPTNARSSREHPRVSRANPSVKLYASGMQGCRSACVVGNGHPGSPQVKSFNVQRTHTIPSSGLQVQGNPVRHKLCTGYAVQCEKVVPGNSISTKSNKYSAAQTMPPNFDPTVHPLQVFPNVQGTKHNQHWQRKGTEKQFLACRPTPGFIPQNAPVPNCCSNGVGFNKEVFNYAKENQMPMNATAPTGTAKETARINKSYNASHCSMSGTDSNLTSNHSHFKVVGNTSDGAPTEVFRSTINEEIEEEMRRAQCMSIPVNHNSERYTRFPSRLNPGADEFSPTLSDSNGNQFTMTKQNGVCYFKQDMGNSVLGQHESNTSYEHEVTEVLVSTSDNILKSYSNQFIPKDGRNFFVTHEQQPLEIFSPAYPSFSGYCTPSDVSGFSTAHAFTTLPTPYQHFSVHTPEPALSANNQMHPSGNYFTPANYFSETPTQYFTPVQSQLNYPREVLPSSDIQMHPHDPYNNPSYTLCSLMPMYVAPPPASTQVMPFSGTEYCPVLMQTPVAPAASYAVPVPAHMTTQAQHSLYSVPEQTPMTGPTQNYDFHAPVFNLQAYYEATQNNASVDPNTPDHSVLSRDFQNSVMTHNSSFADSRGIKWQENMHSETTHKENMVSTVCAETCNVQLNKDEPVTSNIYHGNNLEDVTGKPGENSQTSVSESDLHVPQDSVTDIRSSAEFEECKILLERLRNRELTVDRCRGNVFSEPESQKGHIENWLEVACQIIKKSANKLTIDDMAFIMLVPSLRKKVIDMS